MARLLIDGIDEDAVDFRPSYDGTGEEPVVLPAAFPNLLANGSQGIAVGMATSIPPHNAAELCDAALFLIDNPKARSRTLLEIRQGAGLPDRWRHRRHARSRSRRPTPPGAVRSGCARAGAPKTPVAAPTVVVISEMPWLVQKSRLVEKLAELLNDKKLPLVADVRDKSAEDVRLVIEPRSRTVDAELLMESLFKLTELESRIPLNMNVLVKGRIPQVLGLAEVLREWLDHRRDVLLRRSKHRLAEIEHRLEVLGGYLIAYLNLDKVIKIIRTQDEPKPVLMKTFKLSEVQADAILNMRLRNLRKLEEMEVRPGRTAVRIAGGLCADGSGEISVRDDGPGIGQARLEEIRDGVAEKSSRHIGIGLKNIDDRLRILFGERYGLKIESQPGSYTLVTMRFPGLKEDAREGANRVLSDRCG